MPGSSERTTLLADEFKTPIGVLAIVADERERLRAVGFHDGHARMDRTLVDILGGEEHIVSRHASGTPLLGLSPANRLALEMAATEELERLELEAEARAVKPEWHNEEEIAGIADGLALPQGIVERVDSLKYRSEEAADAESPASSPRSWKRKR